MILKNKIDFNKLKESILKNSPEEWKISDRLRDEFELSDVIFNMKFDETQSMFILNLKIIPNIEKLMSFLNKINYDYVKCVNRELFIGFD